jgi:hypothetical protein
MATQKQADALFLSFAAATLLVISAYRYGWQSFHHTIPPDKLSIDIENAASTAASLGLVLDQYSAGHVPANYVKVVGEDQNEELREEWSHTLERDAPGAANAVLAAYRARLAELDTVTGGMAAPSFSVPRADSSRARLFGIDSTLRVLAETP